MVSASLWCHNSLSQQRSDPIPAAYTIAVRFSEYDVPPEMMEDIVSSTVANFSSDTRESRGGRGRRDDYDDEGRDEYD